jgi:hypothetical protein
VVAIDCCSEGSPCGNEGSRKAQGPVHRSLGPRTASPEGWRLLERRAEFLSRLAGGQQYEEWTRQRNPVRAELGRRFGYGTKHAMHLLRLLRMATGEVRVRRPDAEELLAVRRGSLTFDSLLEQAESLGSRLKGRAEASPLPPDRKAPATIAARSRGPERTRQPDLWARAGGSTSRIHEVRIWTPGRPTQPPSRPHPGR